MNVIDKLKWRYATKKFDAESFISEEKIQILKEAFNLTATSYGLQPVKLIFIKNKELQEKLVKHSMNQKQVAQASHVLVFCIETKIDKAFIETYFERVKTIRNTPDKILAPFKEYLIDDFKDRTDQYIKDWATKQAYIAMGNLLTVLAIEDIDACPMEGFSPEGYDKTLNLNNIGLRPVLVMPIGYRAKDDIFADFKKVRKPLTESTLDYQ